MKNYYVKYSFKVDEYKGHNEKIIEARSEGEIRMKLRNMLLSKGEFTEFRIDAVYETSSDARA